MTRKAFVIGHPIDHSRSPDIHDAWLKLHEIDGSYEAIDVPPDKLSEFFARIRDGEFVGGNITIPLKELAVSHCTEIEADAHLIGAINTIIVRGTRIIGHNTDTYGFLANLDQGAPGWDQEKNAALVLGAGGAAKAIVTGLCRRGFASVHVFNRTVARAQKIADIWDGKVEVHPMADFADHAAGASVLVNTTSVGMHGTRFDDLPLERLDKTTLVTDIVYVPHITPLLADARALGLKTLDGVGMLLHQAVPGFEAWFGVKPDVIPIMRRLVIEISQ